MTIESSLSSRWRAVFGVLSPLLVSAFGCNTDALMSGSTADAFGEDIATAFDGAWLDGTTGGKTDGDMASPNGNTSPQMKIAG